MAIKSGFYNAVNGDREYNAEDMAEIFDGVISDGIFNNVGSVFEATQISSNKIKIGSGKAWFNHKWIVVDSEGFDVTISQNLTYNDRIDAICLSIDNSNSVRAATIKVKHGIPSATPEPPSMTHSATLNEYPLYLVRVSRVRTIDEITACIGSEECPYSAYLLDTSKALYIYDNEEETIPQLPGQFEQNVVDFGSFTIVPVTEDNAIYHKVDTIYFNKTFKNPPLVYLSIAYVDGTGIISIDITNPLTSKENFTYAFEGWVPESGIVNTATINWLAIGN